MFIPQKNVTIFRGNSSSKVQPALTREEVLSQKRLLYFYLFRKSSDGILNRLYSKALTYKDQ